MHKILFYNKFIIFLYMFPAMLYSSSGGQNYIIQHLVSSHSVGGRPVNRILLTTISSICLTYVCCCMYSLELLMMNGKIVRNM